MPTTNATKTCPGCGTLVSAIRPTCRHCGTLLIPPPVPSAPLGAHAPVEAPTPPKPPTGDDRFFAPTVLEPVAVKTPPAERKRGPVFVAIIALALLVLVGGVFALTRSGGSSGSETPVAMPPHGPSNGMPSSLADVVRIQAESSRQIAMSAIAQATQQDATALDPARLAQIAPSLTWKAGSESSKSPHEVSFAQDGSVTTIALAASSKDVCAYGRFEPGAVSQYVTMLNDTSCRAVDAPEGGWSALPGGSSADLPPEGY
jgi:hypothetical protein